MPGLTSTPLRASGLVVLGLMCQEVGASISVLLFPEVGAAGMVTLRVAFSALVLLAVVRPRWRDHTARDWLTVVGFGCVVGAMNAAFYQAIARIPLGIAVTIEVLGPLVLSVVLRRRVVNLLWVALAFCGVTVLGGTNVENLDLLGVGFALAAAALWAAYILGSAATGRRFERLDGLALAMTIGSLLVLPLGVVSAGDQLLDPRILGLGLVVAVLSSLIPYAFELLALRRLPESAFGVLTSLAPAIAALAGLLILDQQLTPLDVVAILLVVGASAGAVLTTPGRELPEVPLA